MMTHENLLTNAKALVKVTESTASDTFLSWLPLTHDMGLVGFHLVPVLLGIDQFHMPTSLFVLRPQLWMQKMSDYRVSITVSPNFGYKHFITHYKAHKEADLDLSGIRLIWNGAEPISADICNRFLDLLEPKGLSRESMYPGYGMAEAGLCVTSVKPNSGVNTISLERHSLRIGSKIKQVHSGGVVFVNVGVPLDDVEVRICNENNIILEEEMVGYIQIKGKNVTQGYYNNHEATHKAITNDGWLVTGDLGFFVNNNLFVTGRAKDIIFVNGENYYANDIERIIEKLEDVELGKIAACGIPNSDNQTDELFVFVVSRNHSPEQLHDLVDRIKRLVYSDIGIEVTYVLPVKSIPKTTSGKFQRFKLRDMYLEGEFDTVIEAMSHYQSSKKEIVLPTTTTEKRLCSIWRDVFVSDEIGVEHDLFELGGNSLKAVRIISMIQQQFGVDVQLSDLLLRTTIREMAEFLEKSNNSIIPKPFLQSIQDYSRTSYTQKRMYILNQMAPESMVYIISVAWEIDSSITWEQIVSTFEQLVQRHESMRTTFEIVGQELVQKVHETISYQSVLFHSGSNEETELFIRDFSKPFELNKDGLFRYALIKESGQRNIILFDIHHIIADGISVQRIIEEFHQVIDGGLIPPLEARYKDFIDWQYEKGFIGRLNAQEAYWLKEYSADIPLLDLPTDLVRPPIQNFEGDRVSQRINSELCKELNECARVHGVTPYITLLTAYFIFLHKHSNQQDIIIGTPFSGRTNYHFDRTVGMFVNTLAIRAQISGLATFKQLLEMTKNKVVSAMKNQDYPIDMLINKLDLEKDLSRNPLFSTMFVMQDIELERFKLSERCNGTSKFDLMLQAVHCNNEYSLEIEYNTNLFQADTAQRMLRRMIVLLQDILKHPNSPIKDLKWYADEEKDIVLQSSNQKMPIPLKGIVKKIEEHAIKSGERTAVRHAEESVNYRELNSRANQLAHALLERGLQKENIVGVLMNRSIDMIVSILALWKIGAVYMPLDPEHPDQRIAGILSDSECGIVLADSGLISTDLEGCVSSEFVKIDKDRTMVKCSSENPNVQLQADDLAYIIYTSGSTGRPKGVMIEHAGMMNHMQSKIQDLYLNEKSIIAQTASHCFDISIWQFFSALYTGGQTVIYSKSVVLEPDTLYECLVKDNITVLEVVPSFLGVFLSHLPSVADANYGIKNLQYMIVTGETLKKQLINQWFNFFPDIKLVNAYGPTEASDDITHHIMSSPDKYEGNIIGLPIPNLSIYILDAFGNLCPPGVRGEIYVSGIGVGRGYLNNPDKTKSSFFPDLFEPDKRMYKTGDIGRILPDGVVEYFGRLDHQVKVRGYRIELGEIESRIMNFPLVIDCVVSVIEDPNEQLRLVCHYVSDNTITDMIFRQELSALVPAYMIPDYFVRLTALPVTSNGKIDRKMLPDPEIALDKGSFTPPTTFLEEMLIKLWEETLDVRPIGITDQFFALGGHSLKAAIFAARLYKEYSIRIQVRDVFLYSTIEQLAAAISTSRTELTYEPILEAPVLELYPATSNQQRLLILQNIHRVETFYNMPFIITFNREFDLARVQKALFKLIGRHESLRTSFIWKEGELYQKVHPLSSLDLSISNEEIAEKDLQETLTNFVQPFDLEQAPLLRAMAGKVIGDSRHFLLLDIHHSIADGVSIHVILKEFSHIYQGNILEPATVQFKDYVYWNEVKGKRPDSLISEQFWMDQLHGELPVLQLPTDFPRSSIQSFDGESIHYSIDTNLSQAIKNSAAAIGTTLYVFMLAAYQVLLAKYSNQEDIIVGSPVAGRIHTDIENTVGMFTNTVVVRGRPVASKLFSVFLEELKETVLQIYEHQEFPFEDLLDKLNHVRDLSRNPIFDTMFVMQNFGDIGYEINGIQVTPIPVRHIKFDLSFVLAEDKGDLVLEVNYCTKLFKKETIQRTIDHYIRILTDIVDNTMIKIGDIELLSEHEKNNLLVSWNQTEIAYPDSMNIHQVFEHQAWKYGDKIALVHNSQTLTYRELNEKSDRLASALKRSGVGNHSFVGLMVDRSFDMVVGMLGIWKAGGAYCPLDPEYPTERIEYMLHDSEAAFVLTTTLYKGNISFDGKVVLLDELDYEAEDNHRCLPSRLDSSPDDPAYVIYTSGTTGRPKGVVVPHRGIVSLSSYLSQHNLFESGDRVIQFASMSFDASIWEIFGTLLNGATLYLVDRLIIDNYNSFTAALNEYGITLVTLPPTYLAYLHPEECLSLKKVITAGSVVTGDIVNLWKEKVRFINAYGPTETSICATVWEADSTHQVSTIVPIGKPIGNSKAYILDAEGKLVPAGVYGELCIAGVGLAKGYMNLSQVTESKFVRCPFLEDGKMYRTGDLARWLDDGSIEFIGRIDEQVKIRGYRIEIEEIQAAILSYSAKIQEAVIVEIKDPQGLSELCAYLVGEHMLDMENIKRYLFGKLPRYMVPTYFIQLEALPLSTNGKVDRKKLPQPVEGQSHAPYTAPVNELEQQLVTIWEEVLGVSPIGTQDHFLNLGGHSLKATHLVSVLHKRFQVEIPLKSLFLHPTIQLLAKIIERSLKTVFHPVLPAEHREYYSLSSAQKRMLVFDQIQEGNLGYNIFGAMILDGIVDDKKFEALFKTIIDRHESLRTSFHWSDGIPVQKIHDTVPFSLEFYEGTEWQVQDIARKFVRPFDLSQAPLLRVGLIRMNPETSVMLVDLHHIIADGISMNILIEEFSKLYEGVALQPVYTHYKDFVEWQSQHLDHEVSNRHEAYWSEVFTGEIPVLSLPLDFPRPPVQSFEGDIVHFTIDGTLLTRIKLLGAETDSTLFMILLSAYQILLSKYSGQEDIIVGSPVAGRSNVEVQHMIGMFVNTLAMRNYPTARKTYLEFLQEVKTNALQAYEHQDYPFERLVETLDLHRDVSRNPIFDTMFVLQNMESLVFNLSGVTMTSLPVDVVISKFDLTLSAIETSDGIQFSLDFCKHLFAKDTMRRFAVHFVEILHQVTMSPGIVLMDIDPIPSIEHKDMKVLMNGPHVQISDRYTLSGLFEDQVAKTPYYPAVSYENETLTYDQLNRKANQLARVIQSYGNGREMIVGIMIERSLEMAIGLLAIAKAGGAFLPIDPGYPPERIQQMIRDSKMNLLLTDFPSISRTNYDGAWIDLRDVPLYEGDSTNLADMSFPQDMAYVIYTSGTTGVPKGVVIEQQSIAETLQFRRQEYGFGTGDSVIQLISFSFDAFVTNFFTPIISGSKVRFVTEAEAKDPIAIKTIIANERITHLACLPSFYMAILENMTARDAESLKVVTVGAEKSAINMVEKSRLINQDIEIINEYGPTECSVITTLLRNMQHNQTSIIGKPIINTTVFILSPDQQIQPIGVIGEICMSSSRLARGYLHNTELTSEKFVNNPFDPGRKMYKTGDLGRWLPDGTIEFIGRMDDQVKIRGYRIELGEIETKLLLMEEIKEAVVSARQDANSHYYLCAYYITIPGITLSVTRIREVLAEHLPSFMIPSYFVPMSKMPISPNGKINRNALPEPDRTQTSELTYVAPRNDLDRLLVRLWEEVLNVSPIGIHDHFFELGGDSIKAIQISTSLQKQGYKMGIKDIFQRNNIAELSKYVTRTEITANQDIVSGRVDLTPVQRWFFETFHGNKKHFNQSLMLFCAEGFQEQAVDIAFRHLTDHHDALRIHFVRENDHWIQYNRDLSEKEVYTLDVMCMDDDDCESRITLEATRVQQLVELSEKPLIRLNLFKTSLGDYLLVVIHHLIIDGVSWRILLQDFNDAYSNALESKEPKFPLKTDSYREWASRLLEYANSNALIREWKEYWLPNVQTSIPSLPVDHLTDTNAFRDMASVSFELSETETELLLKDIHRAYKTEINDILLTALGLTIKEWSGHNRVIIMLEGHGREEIIEGLDVSRTVGWFTAIYPVHLDLTKSEDLSYTLKLTKEKLSRSPIRVLDMGSQDTWRPKVWR